MKKSVLALILIVSAFFTVYGQNTPMDVILILDTSSSMSSSYENVNNYITGSFLSEYLRVGDTFHLIAFSGSPMLDIARRITSIGDVETIIGRMLIQYPVESGNDISSAISFAEQYIASLPARPKKIVIVSTGGGDANSLVGPARQRLSSRNATIDFVQVTQGQPLSNPSSGRSGASRTASAAAASPASAAQAVTTPSSTSAAVTAPAPASAAASPASAAQAVTTPSTTAPADTTPSTTAPTVTTPTTAPAATTPSTTSPSATTSPATQQTQTSPTASATPSGTTSSTPEISTSVSETATAVRPVEGTGVSETDNTGIIAAGEPADRPAVESQTREPERETITASPLQQEEQKKSGKSLTFSMPIIIGLIILALIILGIILFFALRRLSSSPNRVVAQAASSKPVSRDEKTPYADHSKDLAKYAAVQNRQRSTPYDNRPVKTESVKPAEINPSGPLLLNLFVEDQNAAIGKRNIHSLKSGYSLSVGGGQSDFLIFLVPMPANIGEIHRDGSQCSFIPKKPKYFPDLGSNELRDCINKTIRVISDKNYELRFRFEMYEDPLIALNRVLMSVSVPG